MLKPFFQSCLRLYMKIRKAIGTGQYLLEGLYVATSHSFQDHTRDGVQRNEAVYGDQPTAIR